MKILFIIESSVIGPAYIRKAASEMGLRPIFLTNIHKQEGDALCELTQGEFIYCNTESFQELLEIVSTFPLNSIAGVITFLDSKLEICAKLCEYLGVNGPNKNVALLKSKSYVDSIIPEYVPDSVSFVMDHIPYADIKLLLATAPHGLVLKPAFAAGARGVRLLSSEDEIDHISSIVDMTLPASCYPEQIIVQKKIAGELISVEGYVLNGRITYIGITGRRKIGNSESLFLFPYDEHLSEDQVKQTKKALEALVERSSYRTGLFHTEFIVSQNDVKLIDCNFGRPGGANIIEIIACSYGLEPYQVYRNVIEVLIHEKEIIPLDFWYKTECSNVFGLAYGIDMKERVLEICMEGEFESKHTLAQNMGYIVLPMGDSNWAWLGMLSGKTKDVLNEIERIKIKTTTGWKQPIYYKLTEDEKNRWG